MKLRLVWLLATGSLEVLTSNSALALPALDADQQAKLQNLTAQGRPSLLSDSEDANLFYVIPSRLMIVKDDNARPLLRMVVNADGSAEVFLVANLALADTAEADFQTVQRRLPQARIAQLPILNGTLTAAIVSTMGIRIISTQSILHNASMGTEMPLHVTITPEGLDLLKGTVQGPSGQLLAFIYNYEFKSMVNSEHMQFRVTRPLLKQQFLNDATFIQALDSGLDLSADWAMRHAQRALAVDYAATKPVVPLQDVRGNFLYKAYGAVFAAIPQWLGMAETSPEWYKYPGLLSLYNAHWSGEDVIEAEMVAATKPEMVKTHASGMVKGLCSRYGALGLVYDYQGRASCDAIISKRIDEPQLEPVPVVTTAAAPDTPEAELAGSTVSIPNPHFDPLL